MNYLQSLKVKGRIVFLLSILLAALVCIGLIGYYFLHEANISADKMYKEKLLAVQWINDCRVHPRKIESDMYEIMLTSDANNRQSLIDDMKDRNKKFTTSFEKLAKLPLDNANRQEIDKIKLDLRQYNDINNNTVELVRQDKTSQAYTYYKANGAAVIESFNNELIKLAASMDKSAQEMNKENEDKFVLANTLFIVIVIVSVILGILLGWIIVKQITERLAETVAFLKVLAVGDFSQKIAQEHLYDKSEFGDVARAVDAMSKGIRQLIKRLSDSSTQLASSSQELTASAEQSAQASNQVAGSVTEVAHAAEKQLEVIGNANNIVQQISTAISQAASNAQTVSSYADQTAEAANSGEVNIKKAVDQMQLIEEKTINTAGVVDELEDKSKQIGQIVDVISNIAGQTNLLALNAAIEAARAGEAGKGFAVVAEEVRKLAEQSQEAAKQITELITQVQTKTDDAVIYMSATKEQVNAGTNIVSGAGKSFETILHMVRDMTAQIRNISAGIEEITGNIHNVVTAVGDIDSQSKKASGESQNISAATQQQSASTEEIASASQHLAKMAEELQNAIRKFKI
ncbi:methyl-accepting chemotaxis protein [Pectinatus sottacetonis]|uniref:methyl-accepting chemotaxis protein n=1 Tax=Pectinatus sottacetonis TaxID=1002795 RepID=UPI0018C4E9A0|nr:methyl-accepting chemotaxis protein [Pectinatus sottacetonis]